MKHSWGHKNR